MKGTTHPLLVLLLAPLMLVVFEGQALVAVWTEPALYGRGRWNYALREVLGLLAYRLGALR